MPSHSLQSYVAIASEVCARWGVKFQVPADADDDRAASIIRSSLMRAGKAAAASVPAPFYWDDNRWMHDGIRGITRDLIDREQEIAGNPVAESTDEWGIMARVSDGESGFDIPIAMDLDPDSTRNILDLLDGMEEALVDLEALGELVDGEFTVTLHAGNWASLRDLQAEQSLPMLDALVFRRPATWDIVRARLSGLPPEDLPEFQEEAFYSRLARSVRFDPGLMSSQRKMADRLPSLEVKPGTPKWGEWFPSVADLLRSIGDPVPMDGMSVMLNFVVEEPLAEQPETYLDPDHPDHSPFADWEVVGHHNLVVGAGLHPLTAVHLYDVVVENPLPFYDLEDDADRRYRLIGASIIQDSMLSMVRATLNGRGPAYDAMFAAQERAKREEREAAEAESAAVSPIDETAITF